MEGIASLLGDLNGQAWLDIGPDAEHSALLLKTLGAQQVVRDTTPCEDGSL